MTTPNASRHLALLTQMYPNTVMLNVAQIARCINWSTGSIYNVLNVSELPFKIQKVRGKWCASILEVADYLDGFLTLTPASPQTSDAVIQAAPKKRPGRPRGSTSARFNGVQRFQAQLRSEKCVLESQGDAGLIS